MTEDCEASERRKPERETAESGSHHRAETGQDHGVPEAPGQHVGRGEEGERKAKDSPESELRQSSVSPLIFLLHSLGDGTEAVPDGAVPHGLQGEHKEDPPSLPLYCWLNNIINQLIFLIIYAFPKS